MPFKGLTEELKGRKVRHSMMLRSSQDGMVRRAGVEVRNRRLWEVKAITSIQDVESRLIIGGIVGTVATGRQELGTTCAPRWSKADNTARSEMVQREVEEEDLDCAGSGYEGAETMDNMASCTAKETVLEGYMGYGAA